MLRRLHADFAFLLPYRDSSTRVDYLLNLDFQSYIQSISCSFTFCLHQGLLIETPEIIKSGCVIEHVAALQCLFNAANVEDITICNVDATRFKMFSFTCTTSKNAYADSPFYQCLHNSATDETCSTCHQNAQDTPPKAN